MDRIGVIGLGWQRGGPDILARLTVPKEARGARLGPLARALGARELVYLATCNRVEVAVVTDGTSITELRPRLFAALTGRDPAPGEAERLLRVWAGEGAAEHLYLVTAGLDSARVGETDVAGQVREAVETARGAGLVGPRLELIFDGALKVAARAHQLTAVGEGRVSLAEVALTAVREHRAQLLRGAGPVALVGVSPMTERCGRALRDEGVPVLVINRTLARAAELAAELGGGALSLAAFLAEPPPVSALLCATGAPEAVIGRDALARLRRAAPEAPLVVDLAVPPDVDPEDARAVGLLRLGMEEVIARAEASRQERLREMAEARILVDEGLAALRASLGDRLLGPLIAQMRARAEAAATADLDRLIAQDLPPLSAAQEQAVRRFTRTLVRRMIHGPTVGLRALARAAGTDAALTFLAAADEELVATAAPPDPSRTALPEDPEGALAAPGPLTEEDP